jgi:hypothetical protein
MPFNVSKCKVMHIGQRNPGYKYTMSGKKLTAINKERDIGVTVSGNLITTPQCNKAAGTASAVLGQISSAYHYSDRYTFVGLYKQYVRPHLEFSV